jgi:heme/copper-type cytochrome/quinol oxidase subunit 1
MRKNSWPYILLLIAGFILLIVGFFSGNTTDFHVHDTYFVISTSLLFFTLAVLMFVYAVIYFLCKRRLLSPILTWVHLLGITASLCIVFFYQPAHAGMPSPRRYINLTVLL